MKQQEMGVQFLKNQIAVKAKHPNFFEQSWVSQFHTTGVQGQKIPYCGQCSVNCRILSSICGLSTPWMPAVTSFPHTITRAVTIKKVSRHCQRSLGRQKKSPVKNHWQRAKAPEKLHQIRGNFPRVQVGWQVVLKLLVLHTW